MKDHTISFFIFLTMTSCNAQQATQKFTLNPEFYRTIETYISHSVPVLSCEELREHQNSFVLLDTREREEFDVSHLPGAIHVGYKDFELSKIQHISVETPLVLYCSIGYRSEKIGEKLQKAGYQKVSNLYGSIFEWANRGYPLVDAKGEETQKIHAYNKNWSRWVEPSFLEKVW